MNRWLRFALALALVLATAGGARAEQPLDVSGALQGATLEGQLSDLEDPEGALHFDDVRKLAEQGRFVPLRTPRPAFGYTRSTHWLRFRIQNRAREARAWLLELAFPHLDYVTLYVPRPDGRYEERKTGDMLPFSQRDIAFRNFLFSLSEPPATVHTYYLRVQTSGAITLPLTVWTEREFLEHQHHEWWVLSAFYGVLLAMALYNGCLYIFSRVREYIYYTLLVLTSVFLQLTLSGHTFQLFLPNSPAFAQHVLPVALSLSMFFNAPFALIYLDMLSAPAGYRRVASLLVHYCGGLVALGLFAPYSIAIRTMSASTVLLNIVAVSMGVALLVRGIHESLVLFVGYFSLIAGAVISTLATVGIIPANWFTVWSMQIGTSLQYVLFSSGMAGKLDGMRAHLGELNQQLRERVEAVEQALSREREATVQAERALRVKDEFMATMSHELRTPLNAIINIPQGLLEQFPLGHYAVCAQCASCFELEPGDVLSPELPCPECQKPGALMARDRAAYRGRPAHTVHYLQKIERSGRHLLQVVNGILDASRIAAGRLELRRESTSLVDLARDVVDEMTDLAEHAGVRLLLVDEVEPRRLDLADPLRLRQILLNLIGNAIKFSNGAGTVTVTLRDSEEGCVFSVRDEGIGIAPEDLEKVFESFQQVHRGAKREYGGTGLGLSIARSLVQLHGGRIWVESELGRGATFFFCLPRGEPLSKSA